MATISENLQTIKSSTDAIKQAIIDKGGTIEGDITTWANAISNIVSGSGSGGAGSVFKITNKLNGQLLGGPNYAMSSSSQDELLHSYTFSDGELGSNTIIANFNNSIFPNMEVFGYGILENSGIQTRLLSKYGDFRLYTTNVGEIKLNSALSGYTSLEPCSCIYIAFDKLGNYDFDFFSIQTGNACILKDTKITLFNNSTKLIQDINYNDELLVWNFDKGEYDKAKPLWIKKSQLTSYYFKCVFDDNTELNLTGPKSHRLFNCDTNSFEYAINCVNNKIMTLNGIKVLKSCDKIEEQCEFYNIITYYHMNLYANNILTSCRYNNLYPIKDMKFIKNNKSNEKPRWQIYSEKFKSNPKLTVQYLDGLRLYEQSDIPIEETVEYVTRLESLKKTLNDFEENKIIFNDINETNVGWIDPEGNVYGYKLYMPGQMNHIILAEKIGKDLGLQEEKLGGYSRTLEKLGWIKYTNEFLSTSSEITNKQERKIHQFLNNNKKVKERGTIKMGSMFGDENSLDYIKLMPKKDLINKMKGR